MNFIRVRSQIKNFIEPRQEIISRAWCFIYMLVCMMAMNNAIGYQKQLSSPIATLVIAALSAFTFGKINVIVLAICSIVHIFSLDMMLAAVTAAVYVACYLVMMYFRSNDFSNPAYMPICYHLHIPFAMPLASGLLKNFNELASVFCGGFVTYYLHTIRANASEFLDESSEMTAISMIRDNLLKDKFFYFYIVSMCVMFIIIYLVRQIKVEMSWLMGIIGGVTFEFIVMLAGCFITGNKDQIGWLVLGNLIIVVVGVVLNYIFLDLDYSRIEKVQFEDDDYFYYVTAVPKIRIAADDKRVRKY